MNCSRKVSSHYYRCFTSSKSLICRTPPVWQQHRRHTVNTSDYAYTVEFQESIVETIREKFWAKQADAISWFNKPTSNILSFPRKDQFPIRPQWFKTGTLNACFNCVDRHVLDGFGSQVAIYHDSPVTNSAQKISYQQLLDRVNRFAYVLSKELGVEKGDRVLIYMPMIPEAMVTMLACARIGAIHSLVFGGFASKELATRIDHAKPKVIVSASYGVEPTRKVDYKALLNKALDLSSHKVQNCVIYQRPDMDGVKLNHEMDLDFAEMCSHAANETVECVGVNGMEPLYILYTSGTTGQPKAVVRPLGGHLVMLAYTMRAVFDVRPGETYFAASDLGWVVGHSYICYAPLLNRSSTVLYEGKPIGTPDVTAYYRILKEYSPSGLFTAPTALRAIRKEDPNGIHAKKFLPFKHLRSIFVAGEHLDIETLHWTKDTFQTPVIDHFWQTESGSPILAILSGKGMDLDIPPGSSGKAVPGFDVRVINSERKQVSSGEMGHIVIRIPLPPGFSDGLYNDTNDELFMEKYFSRFPGFYDTQDTGFTDINGFISVLSRTDDIINVAGHRLSTSAIEEVMLKHPSLVECAVIPIPDKLKGSVPLGVAVLKSELEGDLVLQEIVQQVREDIGPVAAFNKLITVSKLPKTRSGKISRGTMASLAGDKPFSIPPTIEDVSAYDELLERFQAIGLAQRPQILNRDDFL